MYPTPRYMLLIIAMPGGTSGKESTCWCRRLERLWFDPWVRKICWKRKWQPISVFLAWKIPWTEEPGELQSMGLPKVGHDWACILYALLTAYNVIWSVRYQKWVIVYLCLQERPSLGFDLHTQEGHYLQT